MDVCWICVYLASNKSALYANYTLSMSDLVNIQMFCFLESSSSSAVASNPRKSDIVPTPCGTLEKTDHNLDVLDTSGGSILLKVFKAPGRSRRLVIIRKKVVYWYILEIGSFLICIRVYYIYIFGGYRSFLVE